MTTIPTIHLFYHGANEEQAEQNNDYNLDPNSQNTDEGNQTSVVELYRAFLHKHGHESFEESNLAEHPDITKDLHQRFPNLSLPGILLDDTVWVHGVDGRELQLAWGKAWFDHVLHKNGTINTNEEEGGDEDEVENNMDAFGDITDGYNIIQARRPSLAELQEEFGESLRSADTSQSNSLHTSSSSLVTNVVLPSGSKVDIGALMRLLMRATHHNSAERDGQRFFYFRGFEGMELWSILFFEEYQAEDAAKFGRMLIERGLVHNYTPKCTDFSKTFLVLQPLQEPRVLNSFIKWPNQNEPVNPDEVADPMDVLLRLSRLMDDICATDYRENLHLYHEYEIGCCQLQVLPFPSDQRERVTFVLNLFNMAVRHAVICCEERRWSWPTDLENLHAFFSKVGYKINGTWVSLAELQSILYGSTEVVMPPLVRERPGFFQRWSCRAHIEVTGHSQYYATNVIRTDARLLFAMTFGTKDSPSVATIYPNRLSEGLQTATEAYARQHVRITDSGVKLPGLIGWYRHDLGGAAETALHFLLQYLSVKQMRDLDALWECSILEADFEEYHNWKPELSTLPSPGTQNQKRDRNTNQKGSQSGSSQGTRQIREESPRTIQNTPLPSKAGHGTALDEFSLSPAPELDDREPHLIDPTPLLLSSPSLAASKAHTTTSSKYRKTNMVRQPSFQAPTLLRRLWGRHPSVGDFAPRRPGMLEKTETYYGEDEEDRGGVHTGHDYDHDCALFDDGGSLFQSVVSEITFGSEFQDLYSDRTKRRLNAGRH